MPTLRERISSWFGRAGTNPISFHPGSAKDFGPGIGNQPSHDVLLRESLGIADTATRAISSRVSTLNPLVKTIRRTMAGTTEEEILDDHRLKVLLDRPHPNLTRSQLLRLTSQWIITTGEAYWLKVGSRLGVPIELHPIPPTKVTPLVYQGVVEQYRVVSGDGQPTVLPANVIVRFYFPDPENPWASEGYLGPEAITADSLKFAGHHLRSHYKDDATPRTALEAGDTAVPFTEEDERVFNAKWRNRYHNLLGSERGLPAITPTGYKIIQMLTQSGADIVPLLEYWRNEQLMGMQVPRAILGEVVSGDRSSAETMQYVFDRHAVSPIASLIADGCTLQLAPDFDSKIFVEFEQFVSADKDFRLREEAADLLGKVRSVNQIRKDRGLDPVEWGELPVATIGQQPYDPNSFSELDFDMDTALEDEDEDEEPRSRANGSDRSLAWFAPENEWKRQIRREKKFVPAFLKGVRTVLRDQLRSVLAKLEEQRTRAINPELLFDVEEWEALFRIRVEPVRVAAFEEILRETLAGLGAEEAFILTDQMQKVLLEQGAQLVQHTTRTTKKRIAAQLAEGNAAGEGVDQIAKRIQSVFSVRRKEARTIARTEILKASQTAQLEGFELSGVVERKSWHTSLDAAVRDSHIYAEGQVRDLDDSFDLAGERADAPGIGAGGTTLSAANSINCRCFVLPVIGG